MRYPYTEEEWNTLMKSVHISTYLRVHYRDVLDLFVSSTVVRKDGTARVYYRDRFGTEDFDDLIKEDVDAILDQYT